MVDLPDIIEKHVKKDALEQLKRLNIAMAQYMEKDDFREWVANLRRIADIRTEEKFDRSKMDELHAFYAQMRGN